MSMTREEMEFIARFKVEALRAAEDAARALTGMGDAAEDTAEDFDDMGKRVDASVGQIMKSLTALAASATVAYKTVSGGLRAYGDYNQALINVAKTSDLTDRAVKQLGSSLTALSIDKGIDLSAYTEVAAVAGQLGVSGVENIRSFTAAVVDLSNASNLAGEQGAQTLARMLAVTGEHVGEAERLASVIVRLGNNVAASEREIAESAQQIALATAPFELGTTRATALAAAMAEIGLNPQVTGTTIGRIFIEITNAAAMGGKELDRFAAATGLTADEFRRLQQEDPTQIFMALLETMSSKDGMEIVRTLTELDLMNAQTAKSILPLISNYERLSEVMGMALNEAANPRALAEEVARAEEAFNRMYVRVRQALAANLRELGEIFAPMATMIMQGMLDVLEVFRALPDPIREVALILGAMAPAIVAVIAAFRTYSMVAAALGINLGIVNAAQLAATRLIPAVRAAYVSLTASVAAMGVAHTAAAAAGTALGMAIRFALGPIGLTITAIGILTGAWAVWRNATEDMGSLSDRFEETRSELERLNSQIKTDTQELINLRERLAEATKRGDDVERASAITSIAALEQRIAKSKELANAQRIQLEVAVAEARHEAERVRREAQDVAGLAVFEQNMAEGGWFTLPDAERAKARRELAQFKGDTDAIVNHAIARGQDLYLSLKTGQENLSRDQKRFVQEYEKLLDYVARMAESAQHAAEAEESLNILTGAMQVADQAAQGLSDSFETFSLNAERNLRSVADLLAEHMDRTNAIKDLEGERAQVMAEFHRQMSAGNREVALALFAVHESLGDQITAATDAETRMKALKEEYWQVRENITSTRHPGVPILETLVKGLGQRIMEAAENLKDLNDADLSGLEGQLRGLSAVADAVNGGFQAISGWFGFGGGDTSGSGMAGIRPPRQGESRVVGADERTARVLDAVVKTVINFEGYLDQAKWDVNAYRAGYGSDTVTLSDGSIVAITEGMRVNEADAYRDMERRMGLYLREQEKVMGSVFGTLTDRQVAAIASIQHNYGSIPKDLAAALRTGQNEVIAATIARMAMHYTREERAPGGARDQGRQPINYNRRMEEAEAFGNTRAYGEEFRREMSAASDAYREAKRAAEEARREAERHAKAINDFNTEKLKEAQIVAFGNSLSEVSRTEREAMIELYRYELDLKEKGLELDQKIAGSDMTYREQWQMTRDQSLKTLEILPALREAVDLQIEGMSDAARAAGTVANELTGSFDRSIDHILDRGFRDMQGLAEIFGTSFRNMGAALVKFAMQAMILEPIMMRLRASMSDWGTGGGGGLFEALGGIFGGIFGTRTGKSAKGNVFMQSRTIPMMMLGEAGPEAALPLTRLPDGSLGVRMIGAPGAQDAESLRLVSGAVEEVARVLRETVAMIRNGYEAAQSVVRGAEAAQEGRQQDRVASYAPEHLTGTGGQPVGADRPIIGSLHTEVNIQSAQARGEEPMTDLQAAQFGEALTAHIRREIASFLTDQSRVGGMMRPAFRPYG